MDYLWLLSSTEAPRRLRNKYHLNNISRLFRLMSIYYLSKSVLVPIFIPKPCALGHGIGCNFAPSRFIFIF
jgi:hypothetical protein